MDTEEECVVEKAITAFYTKNDIQDTLYAESEEEHYTTGKLFDYRIARPLLKGRLSEWLEGFEEEDRVYFLRLFESFTYITAVEFEYRMSQLCREIYAELGKEGILREEVLFVLTESQTGVKSGSTEISSALWKVNHGELEKKQIIEAYSKMEACNVIEARAVVFIDDILATGVTLMNTVEAFFTRFPYENFTNTKFYYTSIAWKKRAVKLIKKDLAARADKPVLTAFLPEKAGKELVSAFKSGCFRPEERKLAEQKVARYEAEIGQDGDKSYAMGYGQSKLLLAFAYETPNNTLCSFWKYSDRNRPVFARSGQKRPSVSDLRGKKKHMQNNAYKAESRVKEMEG